MAPRRTGYLLYLLLVSISLNGLSLIKASKSNDGEKKLEEFIEQSLMQLDDAQNLGDHLSQNVDTVAQFLNFGTDQSEELQDAIAQAVDLDELLRDDEESTTSHPISVPIATGRRFVPPSRKPGLLGLLEPEEHNPHILHAKRSINFENLKKETMDVLETLPRGERKFLEEVSQEVVSLEDEGREIDVSRLEPTLDVKPRGSLLRGLMRLVATVWNRGTDVLDRFYQAPEFIMKMPVLGNCLSELKKKGEPFYKTIKLLRHSVYLMKFAPGNPKRVSTVELSRADRGRMEEAKRMISDAGAMALKSVAFKIIAKYARKAISEDVTQEFVTRAFYAILSKVLTAGK